MGLKTHIVKPEALTRKEVKLATMKFFTKLDGGQRQVKNQVVHNGGHGSLMSLQKHV